MANVELDFQDFTEKVKAANPIEDVVEETGGEYRLHRRHGKYMRAQEHDSLVINTHDQYYVWNANGGERGDVFNWIMTRRKLDFWGALLYLAERAKIELPRRMAPSEEGTARRLAQRSLQDTLEIARQVMAKWLWDDAEALAYVRGRGWADETITAAGLGFSGRRTEAHYRDMRGEFSLHGIDERSVGAVAVLGFKGDVLEWGREQMIDLSGEEDWIKGGYIPGMMGRTRLVFPHLVGGKVVTLSGRNILGADVAPDGRIIKSFALPRALIGSRQVFFNHAYSPKADLCVIVEGQPDALSLAQWDTPAVALMGTSYQDQAELLEVLRKRHAYLYLGMDADEAGEKALVGVDNDWPMAKLIGPLGRVVQWPKVVGPQGQDGHDANDWLRYGMIEQGLGDYGTGLAADEQALRTKLALAGQRKLALTLLNSSKTFAERVAEWAGSLDGAPRDEAQRTAAALISQLDEVQMAQYRSRLARALHMTLRDFDGLLKSLKGQAGQAGQSFGEPVETLGGMYKDHYLEILFDPAEMKTAFACRFPDGKVGQVDYLDLDGVRYTPHYINVMMLKNVVLLPSAVRPLRPVKELVAIIRNFVHQYLDLDLFFERLASYYVLFSWLYDAFEFVPYLRALGDYGTGKSRFLQAIGVICYRPTITAGASTTSPIFRMLDKYHGTLLLDEADFGRSDEASDIIKILNTGYMKGIPVLRSRDMGQAGFDVDAFDVYGPKIIGTRKRFQDKATESRCLTKEMGGGVPRGDIPIVLPGSFWDQAREIRNLLLAYRMANWQPRIEVDYNAIDRSIEPRLNQVTMALKTIIEDQDMRKEIDEFIRDYNRQLVVERSQTLASKVLEALVAIRCGQPHGYDEDNRPFFDFSLKSVAHKVNDLIDAENRDSGDDEEEEQQDPNRRRVSPKKCGEIAHNQLQLRTERATAGPGRGRYYIVFDEERIRNLGSRYGQDMPENWSANGHGKVDLANAQVVASFDRERQAWKQSGMPQGDDHA